MAKQKSKPAAKPVKPIPDGYHSLTPYLVVRGGAAALEFYKQAFGAEELLRIDMGGKLGHAEVRIGDSVVMLADEHPEYGFKAPQAFGGTPVTLMLYVEDVDARVEQAVTAGAKLLRPVRDQFYGDRTGTVLDPFGHVWTIATHKEDLAPEELQRRAAAAHAAG
jgi:PhnB protein